MVLTTPLTADPMFWRPLGRYLAWRKYGSFFLNAGDPELAKRCDPKSFHSNHKQYTGWFTIKKSNNVPLDMLDLDEPYPPLPSLRHLSGMLLRIKVRTYDLHTGDYGVPKGFRAGDAVPFWVYLEGDEAYVWAPKPGTDPSFLFFLPDWWMTRAANEPKAYQNFVNFKNHPRYDYF